jgi:hypothetical protein
MNERFALTSPWIWKSSAVPTGDGAFIIRLQDPQQRPEVCPLRDPVAVLDEEAMVLAPAALRS